MHVGAPIRDNGQIIGVVTVAKPNSSLQPYVDRTERRLLCVRRRVDRSSACCSARCCRGG